MAKGMSQQELALATKTWRTYISKIERGTTQPFFDQVYRLAKALGVHPANLVASDRELFIRELLADSFVAEISRIALAPWQRSTILNYARDLAGGD
jgi:transcriptional regulator with XRE-family HTH domain